MQPGGVGNCCPALGIHQTGIYLIAYKIGVQCIALLLHAQGCRQARSDDGADSVSAPHNQKNLIFH
jgi:hypothetical protein